MTCLVRLTTRSPRSSKQWKNVSAHCSQRKCSRRNLLNRDFASSLRAPPADASFVIPEEFARPIRTAFFLDDFVKGRERVFPLVQFLETNSFLEKRLIA